MERPIVHHHCGNQHLAVEYAPQPPAALEAGTQRHRILFSLAFGPAAHIMMCGIQHQFAAVHAIARRDQLRTIDGCQQRDIVFG